MITVLVFTQGMFQKSNQRQKVIHDTSTFFFRQEGAHRDNAAWGWGRWQSCWRIGSWSPPPLLGRGWPLRAGVAARPGWGTKPGPLVEGSCSTFLSWWVHPLPPWKIRNVYIKILKFLLYAAVHNVWGWYIINAC